MGLLWGILLVPLRRLLVGWRRLPRRLLALSPRLLLRLCLDLVAAAEGFKHPRLHLPQVPSSQWPCLDSEVVDLHLALALLRLEEA